MRELVVLFSGFNFTTKEEIVDSFPQTKILQNQELNKRLQRIREVTETGKRYSRSILRYCSLLLFFIVVFFLVIFPFQKIVIF